MLRAQVLKLVEFSLSLHAASYDEPESTDAATFFNLWYSQGLGSDATSKMCEAFIRRESQRKRNQIRNRDRDSHFQRSLVQIKYWSWQYRISTIRIGNPSPRVFSLAVCSSANPSAKNGPSRPQHRGTYDIETPAATLYSCSQRSGHSAKDGERDMCELSLSITTKYFMRFLRLWKTRFAILELFWAEIF